MRKMKKHNKILIIQREQFGYLTDVLKYAEHISDKYDVKVVSMDYEKTQINISNDVKVVYLKRFSSQILNAISLFTGCIFHIIKSNYKFIFIEHFPYCRFVKWILWWKKLHIDVRTLSITEDNRQRDLKNKKLNDDVNAFDSASFITEAVKAALTLKPTLRTYILPLGGDSLSEKKKKFDKMSLLYVGTLHKRNIIHTVEAVHKFIERNPDVPLHYDIVGGGDEKEQEKIEKYIITHNLQKYIGYHGAVPYTKLQQFFDQCNIGLSYIPIIDCYQNQPPTKTFEYILSGLFCVATQTNENKKIITPKNGILHNDNSESLLMALENVWNIRTTLDSDEICSTLSEHRWPKVVENHLEPMIKAELN